MWRYPRTVLEAVACTPWTHPLVGSMGLCRVGICSRMGSLSRGIEGDCCNLDGLTIGWGWVEGSGWMRGSSVG